MPNEEFIREQALEQHPDLYAYLLDLEQMAEPFYGINEEPIFDDRDPFSDIST